MANAIETVLWPGFKLIEPTVRLGGILARKPGYHNSRDHLPSDDYSVGQFSVDRQGPANEGSAIDLTFPDAQAGDYKTIKKYSNRLYAARNGDPRTVYMREFFGQIDNDRNVEGWDFAKKRASSSDSSHLWHIHISIHRKYIESEFAMRAILSILKGQSLADWYAENARDVIFEVFEAELPQVWRLDEDPILGDVGNTYIKRIQRLTEVTPVDGDYGPLTVAGVKKWAGIPDITGTTVDAPVWRNLLALWDGYEYISARTVPGRSGRRDPITLHRFKAKLPVLRIGDSDDAGGVDGSGTHFVRRVQRVLGVTVDGDYGPETANAVKSWVGGDGRKIDLEVWRALYAFLNLEKLEQFTVKRGR